MVVHSGKSLTAGSLGRAPLFHGKGERLHHGDWMIIEKIEDVVVGTSIPYKVESRVMRKIVYGSGRNLLQWAA